MSLRVEAHIMMLPAFLEWAKDAKDNREVEMEQQRSGFAAQQRTNNGLGWPFGV